MTITEFGFSFGAVVSMIVIISTIIFAIKSIMSFNLTNTSELVHLRNILKFIQDNNLLVLEKEPGR